MSSSPRSRSTKKSGARRRGRPRAGEGHLDQRSILECAHRIVRADGLEGLLMRRVAEELDVTPMAIYHYYPNKKALLHAMVEDVWATVQAALPTEVDDVDQFMVDTALAVRRVWLDNAALVNLSMAVAPAEETLISTALVESMVLDAAGFPDAGLAAGALQNYILGSVATWANREVANRFFERDADQVLADARRMMDESGATAETRAIVEARFDAADDANFEPGLRALMRGLRAGAET
jgi:AcrR family transcriptional regulator